MMQKTIQNFILLVLSAIATPVAAQNLVTFPSDSAAIVAFTIPGKQPVALHYKQIDTTISYAHNYRPFTKPGQWYAWLGNNGLPMRNLTPDFNSSEGFNYGKTSFAPYTTNPSETVFYQSKRAYSNVSYTSGPDNENQLEALLSKNIFKGITTGIHYRLISSTGPYAYQKANCENLALTIRYFAPDGRYGAMAGYLLNTYTVQENGGIKNEIQFTENQETNRSVITTRLTSAESRNGNMRAFLTVFYEPAIPYQTDDTVVKKKPKSKSHADSVSFTKPVPDAANKIKPDRDSIPALQANALETHPDSSIIRFIANNDSSATKTVALQDSIRKKNKALQFFGLGRFQYSLSYSRDAWVYDDSNPKSGFYTHIYNDSTTTFDTTGIKKLENEISWTNAGFLHKNSLPVALRFAVRHQYTELTTLTQKKTFSQFIPNASVNLSLWNRFSLSGYGFIVKGDYNDGDLGLRGQINLRVGQRDDDGFVGEAGFYSEMPGYFFQFYESNHFKWENSFDRQETWFAKVKLKYSIASAGLDYYLLNQYVYLDKDATAQQHGAEMSVARLWTGINIKLGRWNIDGQAVGQIASDTSVVKLPKLLVRATIFYTGHLFKKALKIQPGIDFYWYPAYHGDDYMPALQSFYLQDVKNIGGYPWIDLFANFRVKRAILFLRYRHLNAQFSGFNYMDVPRYPLPDGGINFGVSWNFYD
ncbi:MAG: hypothetical protein PHU33_11330 [Bacteroidales bacterium]|nr:hypothetical protein [Bacteroidales bacterium]